jgi:hypothetical protein
VADYRRKAGTQAEEVPPELADLPPQVRQGVMAQIKQIQAIEDKAQLEGAISAIEQQAAQVPPEMKPAVDAILKAAKDRLATLAAAPAKEGE